MEYLEYHGTYADIPVSTIVAAWENAYGRERVQSWAILFNGRADLGPARFQSEDVLED